MKEVWDEIVRFVTDFVQGYGVAIVTAIAVLCVGLLVHPIIRRAVKKGAL